jgi:hypothetical protein
MARLLLDEQLPRQLAPLFEGHEVRTTSQMRWNGLRNGVLLTRAEAEFDVLLTADQNMRFQQRIAGRDIALIVVHAPTLNVEDLALLVPEVLEVPVSIAPGDVVLVGKSGAVQQ